MDFSKYPNVARGHQYALDISSGKIVSCRYVKAACERYLRDLHNTEANFYFNPDLAEKYLRLAQKFEHTSGVWSTKNIVYEAWQCWAFMCVIGFLRKDNGFRRFRVMHLEVARGNGKTSIASTAILFFLALDNPNGNEISCLASKLAQAELVLSQAQAMAERNARFRAATGTQVRAHTIEHPKSNSVARAHAANAKYLDGFRDVLAVCDELHAMKPDVFDVITSGMNKRKDSLLLCITTAGNNVESVGYVQSLFAKQVALGLVEDDSFFSAVYTLDDGDDWADEKVWIKANPNLGVSVDVETLQSKCKKALLIPSDVANFKIKHMNQWVQESDPFFDLEAWDKCADPTLTIESMKDKRVRLGLDMASHIDLASIGLVFCEDGNYTVLEKSFSPREQIKKSRNVLFENCVAQGFLIATEGPTIDYKSIQEEMKKISEDHSIIECLYDQWNAVETAQKMQDYMEMTRISMNVSNLSEPMKRLDSLIRQGKVRHNGSPLLRWCMGNVVVKKDANGNVFPRQSHDRYKIDPVVALILAMAGWVADGGEDGEISVYEQGGGIRST